MCVDRSYEAPSFGYWTLPIYHPFHLLSIIIFFSYIVMVGGSTDWINFYLYLQVPIGYYKIYKFRKNHDLSLSGLSELSKSTRRRFVMC